MYLTQFRKKYTQLRPRILITGDKYLFEIALRWIVEVYRDKYNENIQTISDLDQIASVLEPKTGRRLIIIENADKYNDFQLLNRRGKRRDGLILVLLGDDFGDDFRKAFCQGGYFVDCRLPSEAALEELIDLCVESVIIREYLKSFIGIDRLTTIELIELARMSKIANVHQFKAYVQRLYLNNDDLNDVFINRMPVKIDTPEQTRRALLTIEHELLIMSALYGMQMRGYDYKTMIIESGLTPLQIRNTNYRMRRTRISPEWFKEKFLLLDQALNLSRSNPTGLNKWFSLRWRYG